jgi:hypothetical protein
MPFLPSRLLLTANPAHADRYAFIIPFLLLIDVTWIASATSLKRAPSSNEIVLEITKVQKIYECQGRPKAKDTNNMTQEVLAIAIYRCLIYTNTPFPDHAKELEFVKIGWNIACKKLDIWLEMTPELVRMVWVRRIHWHQLMANFTDHFSWVPCPW